MPEKPRENRCPYHLCEVHIDPTKVEIPHTLKLILFDDSSVGLGDQIIHEPGDNEPIDADNIYSRLKSAFEAGKYRLIISPDGRIKVETW